MASAHLCSSLPLHLLRNHRRRTIYRYASGNGETATIAKREAAVEHLLQWMLSNGRVQSQKSLDVRVQEGPFGLGLFAMKPVYKGQEVLSIPKSFWLDTNTVYQSEIGSFCKGLKPWVAIAIFLIHEKSRKESEWVHYINVLPDTLDSPLFWSSQELDELNGTQLLSSVVGFKKFIEREYNNIMEEIIKPRQDIFNLKSFSLEAFTWAFAILRSRTFPPLTGENLALVPLADMVNHGFSLSNEEPGWRVKSGGLFSRGESLILESPTNFKENQEIVMQYGKKKGNAQLAVDFGFVDENDANDRDTFQLTLQISPSDRFVDDKLDIAEMVGLEGTSYFALYRNQAPPEDMLAFLRLSALAGTDSFLLEVLFRNTVWDHLKLPVSRDNEEAVCEAMIEGCRATLAEYSSTIDEDVKLLDSHKLNTRKRIAVIVRLGEKRILQEQLEWFEVHLADLDKLEYYAERRLRDLGLLDDKGSMTPWVFKS